MPNDRRKTNRFNTAIPIDIRFLPDGTPVQGSAIEIGPNGMRILTPLPLVEASYVHLSFESATNGTFCEGRVVWTQRSEDKSRFESGIDVQRWGGGVPGEDVVQKVSNLGPKQDRRKRSR